MHSARSMVRAHGKKTGGTLLEYALGICIIAFGALVATQMLGCRINTAFDRVTHSLAKAF